MAYCAYFALPAVLGYGRHGRFEAERVIALIACITHKHLVVITRLPKRSEIRLSVNGLHANNRCKSHTILILKPV